jgi:putative endonuclease
MLSGCITHATLRALDWLTAHTLAPKPGPGHQHTGRRGEEDSYFHLRRLGYVMVARNFRTPLRRGEIDLIGWEKDVLCFIEVKTRTTHDVKPAEAAVDRDKQRALASVARDYMRLMGGPASFGPHRLNTASSKPTLQFRFDVVTVYYDLPCTSPKFELFRNAFPVA